MDYDRNSFAKNIDNIATLYDVRYTYNKSKHFIHSDEGLKEKFKERITGLIRKVDEVTGETVAVSHCPLLIDAVEEILEYLEDDLEPITRRPWNKSAKEIIVVSTASKKKKHIPFEKTNDLEEFFNRKSNSGKLLEELTLEAIKKSLKKFDYNLTRTATHLGICTRTLRTKIREINKREGNSQM